MTNEMCHLQRFLLFMLLAWICKADDGTATPPKRVYQMYHSLRFFEEEEQFLPRGSITLSPSSVGVLDIAVAEDESISLQSREDFDYLVNSGKLYRIKLVDAENPEHSIILSTLACDVRRANFREEISLMLSHTGTLISASYRPVVSKLAPSCTSLPTLFESLDLPMKFKTTITYSFAKPAMTIPLVLPHMRPPPGYLWFQRFGEGGPGGDISIPSSEGKSPFVNPEEQAKTQQSQQKGFFQKYWYIIMPLCMILLSNPGDDKRGTKPSQSQSVSNAATSPNVPSDGNSAIPADSNYSSRSDTLKQRRGKQQK